MDSSKKMVFCCGVRHLLAAVLAAMAACAVAVPASAQLPPDLAGGQFAQNCGNATAAPIFDAALMNSGRYGVRNVIAVSDPDIVLIGNQWWMIFATGPGEQRAIEPFAAYLPPGASLATATTYPSDPNGWHLVGAQADGQGTAIPVSPIPGAGGWDLIAAETPSVTVGPDGQTRIYYSGHNAGQTPFQIGLMSNFANGQATGNPNPVMTAVQPWEFSSNLPALLEQSVRWMPQLNKYIMYYTAGAWWASPPDNTLAYAESTDGVTWVNRQKLDFPVSYYNQDFLYNPSRNRYEMVISNDPTGAGGANPRNLVWRTAATPAVAKANWVNEVTLLQYNAANNAAWYNSGILSPAVKYGNLPGETNRMYVFFHSYTQQGDMFIGRFYCDAPNTFYLTPSPSSLSLTQGAGTATTISVTPQNGFKGTVNFSVSGFPAGVNNTLLQTSSTSGTTLVMYVQPGAPIGQYPITVTGTSGGLSETATLTLNVTSSAAPAPQTITFNPIAAQHVGGTLTVSASASSGLPVSFSVVPNGNCSISGNVVTFTNAGNCGVIAAQGGNGAYAAAAAVGQIIAVNNPVSQTISFGPVTAPKTVGSTLTLSATASSGLPVSYVIVPNGNCSLAGNVVTFLNPGNCGVIATQAGNGTYLAAASVGQIIVVE